MTLTLAGTLPVSLVNIGLATTPVGIAADIAVLNEDILKLTASLVTQLEVTINFPPSLGYTAAFALALDPLALAASFNPLNWITANADANLSLILDLAFADLQIGIVAPLIENFKAGLGVPGLYGWTYAGNAKGFGESLAADTAAGFPGVLPGAEVNALVIATNSFTSWGSFGNGVRTGASGQEDLGTITDEQRLQFVGALSGSYWSFGLNDLFVSLDLLLKGLQGRKAAAEAAIEITLGLNLPSVEPIIDAGLEVDLTAALEDMVSVQTDLTGEIGFITARIDALLELSGSIAADISAGGLTFWSYSGTAAGLGQDLAAELAQGLPSSGDGPSNAVYGLVLASADPGNWDNFGRVFLT